MSNLNKNSSGHDKTKAQLVGINPSVGTTAKRSLEVENATKKIKLETSSNMPTWNSGNILSGNKDDQLKVGMKDGEMTTEYSKIIPMQQKPPGAGEVIVIRNYGAKNVIDIAPLSPKNPDEITLLGLTAHDSGYSKNKQEASGNSSECGVSSLDPSIPLIINKNAIVRKDNPRTAKEAAELISVDCSEAPTNELELVPHIQDPKESSIAANSDSVKLSGARIISALNSNMMRHGTVTYTRIATSSSMTTSSQSTPAILNRMNVPTPLKSQQLVVTTKKLSPEVTQTTAKVSIGNTTISVPLLKPLNTSQVIHSNNLPGDSQKGSQSANIQTHSSQTQFISKLLNVKCGQKGNNPTIVSLSQLQIKPVSAKLVPAKVLSKASQVAYALPTGMQSNAGVVTITASKSGTSYAPNIFCQKKQVFDGSSEDDRKMPTSSTIVKSTDTIDLQTSTDLQSNADNFQKIKSDKGDSTPVSVVCMEKNMTVIPTSLDDIGTNASTIKQVLNSANINRLPLLTPLAKLTDSQMVSSLHPTVSIIRQTTPQSITTSATGTCVSTSINISDANIQGQDHINKSPITFNTICGKSLKSIPKNIQLMIAPNNINQQGKTAYITTKATTFGDKKIKKINLSVSSGSSVCATTVTQTFGSLLQTSDAVSKQAIISVSAQPPSSSFSTEQATFSRKPVKLTPVISQSGQLEKRIKMSDISELDSRPVMSQSNASSASNLDSLTPKRSLLADNYRTINEAISSNTVSTPDKTIETEKAGNDVNIVSVSDVHQSIKSKSEESNNVLLKQLLQNSSASNSCNLGSLSNSTTISSSTASPSPICSQVLSARKVINVRAPSLGLVSSLEAQLARPVIPPVPTTSSTHSRSDTKSNTQKSDAQDILQKNIDVENNSMKTEKRKSLAHISKETSFVSNPSKTSEEPVANYPQVALTCFETGTVSSISSNASQVVAGKEPITSLANSKNHIETNLIHAPHEDAMDKMDNNSYIRNGNTILAISSTTASIPTQITTVGSKTKFQSCTNKTNATNLLSTSGKNNVTDNQPPATLLSNTSHLNMCPLTVNRDVIEKRDDVKSPKISISNATDFSGSINPAPTIKQENDTLFTTIPNPKEHSLEGTEVHSNSMQDNSALKETEMRKKRKREYQKNRRQLLNSKELSTNLAHNTISTASTKKRSRKISKIEEDYDNFTESLMSSLRQMKPLQVLEPMLNRNCAVCSAYGMSHCSCSVSNKECGNQATNLSLIGEYGSAQLPNSFGLYDTVPFSPFNKGLKRPLSTMQNDFYDQEFSTTLRSNEHEKFMRLYGVIRDRNVEPFDVVGNSNQIHYQNSYPGLVLTNKKNYEYLGRMSPILPLIEPTINRKKYVVLQRGDLMPNIGRSQQQIKQEIKQSNKCDKETNDRIVTLSMPLSSVSNVFGVLKDLANLLHIAPPIIYKIIDAPIYNFSKSNAEDQTVSQNSIQKIICGRDKRCCSCGKIINAFEKGPLCRTKHLSTWAQGGPLVRMYFCQKSCYETVIGLNNDCNNIQKMPKCDTPLKLKEENTECNGKSKYQIENKADNSKDKDFKTGRFKYFSSNCFHPHQDVKRTQEKNIHMAHSAEQLQPELLTDLVLKSSVEDIRQCVFCSQHGDGLPDGPSRLLNFEINKWVHLNCALWSNEVYETISGGLMNFQAALQTGLNQSCSACQRLGATVRCFKNRCGLVFHFPCAIKEQCAFYKNKTIHCQQHATRLDKENELTSLIVQRRVFVERDENRQVAAVMHHSELTNLLRVGTLIFLSVGQLLPHQLEAFHTFDHIYPIGYKVIRFYWSMKKPNKRCRYICSIAEVAGRPDFRIQVQDPQGAELELRDSTPNAVWQQILTPIALMRKKNKIVELFPQFISGEDLFGLTEPSVVRIIESLPGVETLTDYRFKYGRNPLLELPLAINPSGAARTEPKQRQIINWRKPHTQRTGSSSNQRMANSVTSAIAGEIACPYSKQFVHSKSSQYKKMKQEWRNNVYLARSKIQGLGLYAARDIEKHTMIIEYIGEVIRTEVSEIREKQYEARNRGIYMFRLDEERVVDATLSGGLARYINHACNPNCVTEIVDVDRELRIIIFAKRRINRGEELSYDYKFDIEDDAHKISCMCGAPNCRKWMN